MSIGARSGQPPIDSGPPSLLLVYRDAVPHTNAAEYDAIESGIARSARELGCPHPYLGLRTISGESEVWFLNGFASLAEQEEVVRRYEANAPLMAALTEGFRRKSGLLRALGQHLAFYRPEKSAASSWTLGRDPYLVIAVGDDARPGGANFEAPDGLWFMVAGTPDAETALSRRATEGSSMRALEVRPAWSYPAPEWQRSNPQLWNRFS